MKTKVIDGENLDEEDPLNLEASKEQVITAGS